MTIRNCAQLLGTHLTDQGYDVRLAWTEWPPKLMARLEFQRPTCFVSPMLPGDDGSPAAPATRCR